MKISQGNPILSDHPVSADIRERVLDELQRIEHAHDVTVIYACESGSRGWGFASPDSDYDVRFLYVHKLDWYLNVEPARDVIEKPIDDELDVSGWELRKALQLMHRSNPTLLEWLHSPIVYRSRSASVHRLKEIAADFFSPLRGRHHYFSMARKNFHEYLQAETVKYKKYLYALRPLLAVRWIDAGKGMPPMRFADLVDGTVEEDAMRREINELLAIKMRAGEAEFGPRRPALHALIESLLVDAPSDLQYKRPEGKVEMLDDYLRATIRDATSEA